MAMLLKIIDWFSLKKQKDLSWSFRWWFRTFPCCRFYSCIRHRDNSTKYKWSSYLITHFPLCEALTIHLKTLTFSTVASHCSFLELEMERRRINEKKIRFMLGFGSWLPILAILPGRRFWIISLVRSHKGERLQYFGAFEKWHKWWIIFLEN